MRDGVYSDVYNICQRFMFLDSNENVHTYERTASEISESGVRKKNHAFSFFLICAFRTNRRGHIMPAACGATTRSGAPCKRSVHSLGERCAQHRDGGTGGGVATTHQSNRPASAKPYRTPLPKAPRTHSKPEIASSASSSKTKPSTSSAVPTPSARMTAADARRCVHLLTHPPKAGKQSGSPTMQKYARECASLLDRMCAAPAAGDGLLGYDGKCESGGGEGHAVVDVYNGKACCGEVAKGETLKRKAERLLRVAIRIAETTASEEEVRRAVELSSRLRAQEEEGAQSSLRTATRSLFGYVHSLFSAGMRRPMTLMIMTCAVVLVGMGITSSIVANLTNSVGAWEVGVGMSGLTGRAAEYAAKTELTRQERIKQGALIDAALQVVRGALGGTVAGALVGWASPAAGAVAAASAAASVVDLQSASSLAGKAAFVMAPAARLAGEALLRFLVYSASYE